MYERVQLVELIESAHASDPFCPACGAPTQVVDEDGAIVLRCSEAMAATSVLARIGAALVPHLQHTIVAREDLLAA